MWPLLDRIDIHMEVPRVTFQELMIKEKGEDSKTIGARVKRARERQLHRFRESTITCNAGMKGGEVRAYCQLDGQAIQLLKRAFNRLGFSARAHDRIIKIARTIADLEEKEEISSSHVAEAIQYRSFDRIT